MKTLKTREELKEFTSNTRKDGKSIGIMMTYGSMHDAHSELIRVGKTKCDIFIMILILLPDKDNKKLNIVGYPRDVDGDLKKAMEAGVDATQIIEAAAPKHRGKLTSINVKELGEGLCTVDRGVHFIKVITNTYKIINTIKPNIIVYGKKDFQRQAMIHKMIEDLSINIETVEVETMREKDGLAMSTRNMYLTDKERIAAKIIPKCLNNAKEAIKAGEKNSKNIINSIKKDIESEPLAVLSYAVVCHPKTLKEIDEIKDGSLIALAVHFGKARLIDSFNVDKIQ